MKETLINGFLFGLGALSAVTLLTVRTVGGHEDAKLLLKVLNDQLDHIEDHEALMRQGEMIFSGAIAEA